MKNNYLFTCQTLNLNARAFGITNATKASMKKFALSFLALGIILPAFAQNITMGEWRMHEGNEGIVSQEHTHYGDPKAYDIMNIPVLGDKGWKKAPVDSKGMIQFGGNSASKLKTTKKQVDFTYFETVVNVPKNMSISTFTVSFGKVDDGARAYVFNSKYKTPVAYKGQIKLGEKPVTADYSEFIVPGERNRIVIVQFDDAGKGNNLKNAQVVVNGEALKIQTAPWRMHEGNEGILSQTHAHYGDPIAYSLMNIPAEDDSKWGSAPLDDNMAIQFGGDKSSKLKTTKQQVDFTYFDTFITIPTGVVINEFKVSFGKVDDGARAYIINAAHPKGAYKGQIKLGGNPVTEDYKDLLVTGKNRIVIVQFDDAGTGNNLKNAEIILSY